MNQILLGKLHIVQLLPKWELTVFGTVARDLEYTITHYHYMSIVFYSIISDISGISGIPGISAAGASFFLAGDVFWPP